jgi:hypothetical protein
MAGQEHTRGKAHAAIAATLLRQLRAVVTTGQKWGPVIVAGGRIAVDELGAYAAASQSGGRGRAHAAEFQSHSWFREVPLALGAPHRDH